MNRIDNGFKKTREKGESALVGFLSAGDPSLPDSLDLIISMCRAGLDVLELGVPYSDPTADGPVIQRASQRALKEGASLARTIEMTAAIRKTTDIPIILFSYYNPIHAYGREDFYRDAVVAGADGVLVVDLPPEESDELTDFQKEEDFPLIRLVSPATPKARIERIVENASGFVYLICKIGVTGSNGLDVQAVRDNATWLRRLTPLPVCAGFGITTVDDVAGLAPAVEGIVVGSAFERTIEENLNSPDLVGRLEEQVKAYKAATKVREI